MNWAAIPGLMAARRLTGPFDNRSWYLRTDASVLLRDYCCSKLLWNILTILSQSSNQQ